MSLFRLDASILPATSASRSLADLVESEWTTAHPDSAVTSWSNLSTYVRAEGDWRLALYQQTLMPST